MLSTVLSLYGECLPVYVRSTEVISGGGGGIYVSRYVKYVNSEPSKIAKPQIEGIDIFLTIHCVCDSPFPVLLQILLIGYYKSG